MGTPRCGAAGLGQALALCVVAACWLYSVPVRAQSWSVGDTDVTVGMHGFVSQGYLLTTGNNYLDDTKKDGSFEFSEVGLNVTAQLTDELRVGMQLFARDLGDEGNYKPQFDWYYLDYRLRDWFGIRAGRTKIPFGLYNEVQDVDMARVPALLPQAVYPVENRSLLLAQTGGEVYGRVPLSLVGALEYRLYGGTIFGEPPPNQPGPTELKKVKSPFVAGGRFMWQPPVEGLQLGASLQAVRFDLRYQLDPATTMSFIAADIAPAGFTGALTTEFTVKLWLVSAEYALGDLLLAAEYGRWHGKLKSNLPPLLNGSAINERGYLMASYHVTPWFTPGVYYGAFYEDYRDRKGRDAYHHDAAVTLRFDINRYWLLKLEGHYMQGTAGLDSDLNHGTPLSELKKHWGLFVLKTTAYF